MTGPRGSDAPEVGGLGAKVPKPAAPAPTHRPAPDVDADKCIEIGPDGKLRTNDPRNEVATP